MLTAAVLRYLDAAGLVTFGRTGTDAFLEDLPDKPVAGVAAYSRPGGAETDGGNGYDEPGFQLVVRGDPGTGRARSGFERAAALRAALHGLHDVTLAPGTPDEVYLVQCLATTSAPVNLGVDADNRPRWTIDFRTETYAPTALRP